MYNVLSSFGSYYIQFKEVRGTGEWGPVTENWITQIPV